MNTNEPKKHLLTSGYYESQRNIDTYARVISCHHIFAGRGLLMPFTSSLSRFSVLSNILSLLLRLQFCSSHFGNLSVMGAPIKRVQYGQEVTLPKRMQYMARVVSTGENRDTYDCGGTLISTDVILSAAHCFYNDAGELEATDIQVYIRGYSQDGYTRGFTADGVMKPSVYNPDNNDGSMIGDIALVHLRNTSRNPKYYVEPVQLARGGNMMINNDGGMFIIAGYGETEDNDYSDELLFASVPYVPREDAQAFLDDNGLGKMEKDHFGAGYDEEYGESCQGDSGGPLIIPGEKSWGKYGEKDISFDVQVGVASYGADVECGEVGTVGFYTNVTVWYDWIWDTIRKGEYDSIK